MISLFTNIKLKNKLFQFDNKEIKVLKKDVNIEEKNNQKELQNIISSYENREVRNVVIKAFNFEPNINMFEEVVRERKTEIERGIKHLKNLYDLKIFIRKGDNFIKDALKECGEIIELSNKEILKEERVIKSIFLDNNVKVYDVLDMSLLGNVLEKEEAFKVLTVYGSAIDYKGLIAFNEDLTYMDLFNLLNGNKEILVKVIDGGVFTGKPIYDLNAKISFKSKSILFLTEKDCENSEEESCIRCGKCIRICPENLSPIKILEKIKLKEDKEVEKLRINNCIECGLCSYICPSKIEILQKIKVAKTTLNRR